MFIFNCISPAKILSLSRYRYIVMATIGSNTNQGFIMATNVFWDKSRDNFVTESLQVDGEFIVVTVYGVYLD